MRSRDLDLIYSCCASIIGAVTESFDSTYDVRPAKQGGPTRTSHPVTQGHRALPGGKHKRSQPYGRPTFRAANDDEADNASESSFLLSRSQWETEHQNEERELEEFQLLEMEALEARSQMSSSGHSPQRGGPPQPSGRQGVRAWVATASEGSAQDSNIPQWVRETAGNRAHQAQSHDKEHAEIDDWSRTFAKGNVPPPHPSPKAVAQSTLNSLPAHAATEHDRAPWIGRMLQQVGDGEQRSARAGGQLTTNYIIDPLFNGLIIVI